MRTLDIGLFALFSSLLNGCLFGSSGDGCGDATDERDETVLVDAATFDMYTDAEGNLGEEACQQLCQDQLETFSVVEWTECTPTEVPDSTDHEVHCVWVEQAVCVGGRDGRCIESRSVGVGPEPVAAWLAGTVHAEAASVRAFTQLRRDLIAHGAPPALIEGAARAARDEVAHARAVGRLAARRGGRPQRLKFREESARALEDIVRENAVEGCVAETWSAMVACHQARMAADPEIRRAMGPIAVDESRHAELAHAVDAWARTRLDDAALARIDAARREAIEGLVARLGDPDPALARAAGLPARDVALQLAAGMRRSVWA